MAEYEFMYPENIKALGVSMNTNVGSTTVQAELTYRPNFPLATSAADQGQQLSDAVGTTNLLAQAVAKGGHDAAVAGSSAGATAGTAAAIDAGLALSIAQYQANVPGGSSADGGDILAALKSFNRSYLPRISAATIALQLLHYCFLRKRYMVWYSWNNYNILCVTSFNSRTRCG